MEWTTVQKLFPTEKAALQAAEVVATTESRLSNRSGGPRYEIETRVEQDGESWRVLWRKVFAGVSGGCGSGCGSCHEAPKPKQKAKVIPFRRPPGE